MGFRADKEKKAIFVDLANFYSQLIKYELKTAKELRDYFIGWFDFTNLSLMLTDEKTDVWVFYSGNKIGGGDAKIADKYLSNLINRLNQQIGVTCHDVNIVGEQREPYTTKCKNCSEVVDTIWKSEKGIDSSLIVHLFDTMEYWDTAYLLSGDADFVPAVKSLRRRGKIVNGAGFTKKASSALVRECFDYINLENFFISDFVNQKMFGNGGIISIFFTELIPDTLLIKQNNSHLIKEFRFRVSLNYHFEQQNMRLELTVPKSNSSEWSSKVKKFFDGCESFEDEQTYFYRVYLESYFKDSVLKCLANIADDQSLATTINDNLSSLENSYSAYFIWNDKSQSYVRDLA